MKEGISSDMRDMKDSIRSWSEEKNTKEAVLASAAEMIGTQLDQMRHGLRQELDQLWQRCETEANVDIAGGAAAGSGHHEQVYQSVGGPDLRPYTSTHATEPPNPWAGYTPG